VAVIGREFSHALLAAVARKLSVAEMAHMEANQKDEAAN
jgi:predicted ATPase